VLGLLQVQQTAGNAVARQLVRAHRPTVQRVNPEPIPPGGSTPQKVESVWRIAKRFSIVIRPHDGGWRLDRANSWPAQLSKVRVGVRQVNAFVQPFDAASRNELWLFITDEPGGWGAGSGSHTSAQRINALAAGEAQWTLHADDTVTLEAVNNRTSLYKLDPIGSAQQRRADPRVLQSQLLAEQHRLTFHGWADFRDTAYAQTGAEAVDGTTVATLPRGQYLVTNQEVSRQQREKLLRDGITPQNELITYRPTLAELSAGPPPTATLSTADNSSLLPSGTNSNTTTTTTTTTTTATGAQDTALTPQDPTPQIPTPAAAGPAASRDLPPPAQPPAAPQPQAATEPPVVQLPAPRQPAPDEATGNAPALVPMATDDASTGRLKHKDKPNDDDRDRKKARSTTDG
jgi:hypothetical protein